MPRSAAGRREGRLEAWCVGWARSRGIVASKLTDPAGIPDHVFWSPGGRPTVVEFKDASVDLTDPREGVHLNQWYHLVLLAALGYRTAIVTTREGFRRLIDGTIAENI